MHTLALCEFSQAEYTTSTRHFLLIGFLAMFVGSVVFCYLSMRKKSQSIKETVTFVIAAVAAGAYYSMWSGCVACNHIHSGNHTQKIEHALYFFLARQFTRYLQACAWKFNALASLHQRNHVAVEVLTSALLHVGTV
jgi:hypothetical protein